MIMCLNFLMLTDTNTSMTDERYFGKDSNKEVDFNC